MPKLHSERARTPVVPSRSDVLKQSSLQSFKTRRLNFDKDVKIKSWWFQTVAMFENSYNKF
ncbi:hypothetical protein DWQ65_05545 [Treponema phagedenis]|uniref:Uncharacterized protein n=1 Tax=Treponema phagedenis TaxID=162 RepID=A0A0B7GR73_TREPH|nr:hypothetical protein FUT79_04815 [Treponema phagedenis]QEJ97600.1 hypothetical protein FUT82_06035 [Treponema phagedenis]QEK00569.1 hypothetical protein FUT84_04880 [Treponema phagedenis]QEK03166.1 hypothetical protein FUT83_04630 [Treponema phagedenis]QEK05576.1 hypothetical protein FUT80_01790 [Treponema phagedenis]